MKISNIHERTVAAPVARVGALLDTLSSDDDRFWPHENWSRVKFDRPLGVGASGGHRGGRYAVSSYTPGKHVRFEFLAFANGYHEFRLEEVGDSACLLKHITRAKLTTKTAIIWYLAIRPLHDALIEDLFDKVEGHVSSVARPRIWSARVKLLRRKYGGSLVKSEIPPLRS
jgi:hypothetical protein